jgi:hypothetical protein
MQKGASLESNRPRLRFLRRAGLAAAAAALSLASVAVAAEPIPSPSSTSYLNAVACVLPKDCWVVGSYRNSNGAYLNQIERWGRRKWKLAKTPQPGGKATLDDQSGLNGVACTSKSNCWAVGYYTQGGPQFNEIFRWNGKKWTRAKVPQPGGRANGAINVLAGVSCVSNADCWAVGVYTASSGGFVNQSLRWNGKRWTQVSAPDPGGKKSAAFNLLQGVDCASRSDCWAVGDFETSAYFNQALHWNGKRWSRARPPQPGPPGNDLASISCPSKVDCIAVGDSGGGELNQVLVWNGKRWSHGKVPSPGGTALNDQNQLSGVTCTSKSNCWAVGYFSSNLGASNDQALRWNGKRWSHVKTPQPGGTSAGDTNELRAVTCVSIRDCWAVGQFGNSSETLDLALHWNGTKWSSK